jgi:hypothetical protein
VPKELDCACIDALIMNFYSDIALFQSSASFVVNFSNLNLLNLGTLTFYDHIMPMFSTFPLLEFICFIATQLLLTYKPYLKILPLFKKLN